MFDGWPKAECRMCGLLTCLDSKAELRPLLGAAGLSGSTGPLFVLSPTAATINGRQLPPRGPGQQLSVQKKYLFTDGRGEGSGAVRCAFSRSGI